MGPLEKSLWKWKRWITRQGIGLGTDVFEEVAFRALRRYGSDAYLPGTLIKKITFCVVTDCIRSNSRHRVFSLDSVVEPSREDETLKAIANADECTFLLRLASELPAADRDAVIRTLRGQSVNEIAAACGVSIEAINSRLQRGRKQLRVIIRRRVQCN